MLPSQEGLSPGVLLGGGAVCRKYTEYHVAYWTEVSPRMPCQWYVRWGGEGPEIASGRFWLVSPFLPYQLDWSVNFFIACDIPIDISFIIDSVQYCIFSYLRSQGSFPPMVLLPTVLRVETKTVFSIFAKSENDEKRKWCENEQIFSKFCFAKIFVSQEVLAKMGTFLR
jgi:hypothetical protein